MIFLNMDESLDECGTIQALESLSADSCDELEVSMGNFCLFVTQKMVSADSLTEAMWHDNGLHS